MVMEINSTNMSMLESLPIGVYIYQDGYFKFVNRAFCEMSGYTRDELLFTDYKRLITPEGQELLEEFTNKAIKGRVGGLPTSHVVKSIRKDGSLLWVIIIPTLVEYEGRNAILGCVFDITDIKSIEEWLKIRLEIENVVSDILESTIIDSKLEERIELCLQRIGEFMGVDGTLLLHFIKNSLNQVYVWDSEHREGMKERIKDVNFDVFRELVEEENFVSISSTDDVDGETREILKGLKVESLLAMCFDNGVAIVLLNNRPKVWTEYERFVLKELGKILVYVIERGVAIEQMERYANELRTLYELASVKGDDEQAVLNEALNTIVRNLNASAGLIILGKECKACYGDVDNIDNLLSISHTFSVGEEEGVLKLGWDGIDVNEVQESFIESICLQLSHLIERTRLDVDIRRYSNTIRDAYHELKKLDELKMKFVDITLHDLKGPLTTLHGYLSLIEDSDYVKDERLSQMVNAMVRSTSKLEAVVGKLLSLVRIEDGRMEWRDIYIGKLIDEILSDLSFILEQKGLNVEVSGEEIVLKGDEASLRQLIYDVVENISIRTSRGGKLNIIKRVEGEDAILEFVAEGTSLSDFEKLLSPEYITSSRGLGLYLASEIAKLHQGSMEWQKIGEDSVSVRVHLPRRV